MVGTPRSGKMSRDMRSTARKPTNATATTIVKSEIGRRNANDTRFIVRPQPALPRPDAARRPQQIIRRHPGEMRLIFLSKCSAPRSPTTSSGEQNLDGEPSWDAGGLQAPTIHDDPTLQSNAIVSSKLTFMFLKSNLRCEPIVGPLGSIECYLPTERRKCSHAAY